MGHSETLPPGHYHHVEPEQAYHASKLGMWIFLATEIHLFGGIFAVFAIFRWKYLEQFNEYAQTLNWKLGALNTAILLTSSFTMVLAVDAAQKGLNKRCGRLLLWTLLWGCGFFVVKGIEYYQKFSHDLWPSTHVFYGLYFVMTGIHALHVAIGLGLIYWLWRLTRVERFSPVYYTPVEICGLYWHLVDVIWIFLFPVVYLLGGIPGTAH